MQIDRLFQIVYILLEKRSVTAKELAKKLEVSPRTIYRDMEVLSQCGIPIYTIKGKRGGIGLLEGFVLNKFAMTEKEQNQIWTALQSLPRTEEDTKAILKKYGSFFQKTDQNWIQVDFSKWGKEKSVLFEKLKKAIFDKKVICFTYYNSAGEKTFRTAEPYQLWFKEKNWYLKAYCRVKKDFRLFKVSRIKNVVVTEELFDGMWQKEVGQAAVDTVTILLEINKKMAYRVYDEFEEEQIFLKENGDFLVTIQFAENQWLYGYILSWGGYAFVKEPDAIKQKIEKELKKMINQYKI